jgi:regulator of sigma E protease
MHFFLYYILPFVFVLGILIFFHELGHFLVAKSFGVKVLKFSLGFGPKVVGRRVGETDYLISAFPLGGYVKMLGENTEEEEQPLSAEEEKRAFHNQHVLKRIAIVAAGPAFNFLLALLIFCFFYMAYGTQVMIPEIGEVRQNSPADQGGLSKGDVILSIDGMPIEEWSEIKEAVQNNPAGPLSVTVRRGDGQFTTRIIPEEGEVKDLFGQESKAPLIGIVASGDFRQIHLGPIKSIQEGGRKTWEISKLTVITIVKLFERVVPIQTLGGPILIGQMTGELAQENLSYLIPFMAVISVNLAILNLLPVPILDGGMIFFLLIELIVGKPLSVKKRDWAQRVGLAILMLLMLVVMYNDVLRLLQ